MELINFQYKMLTSFTLCIGPLSSGFIKLKPKSAHNICHMAILVAAKSVPPKMDLQTCVVNVNVNVSECILCSGVLHI